MSTVDDLVERLRTARRERAEQRMLKSVRAHGRWEDDDGDIIIISAPSSPKQWPICDMNTPRHAFNYVNKYFLLGAVMRIPFGKTSENDMCELLYDLSTFPLPMVIERMKKEGFDICSE